MCTGNILFTEPPEIVPFTFGSESIDQGKYAQLTCVIRSGDKPIVITWSLKGDIINSGPTLSKFWSNIVHNNAWNTGQHVGHHIS